MAGEAYPSGWRLAKLTDLGEVNRGRSRHRPRYAEHLYGGPYPFIQTGDVRSSGGRIATYRQTYSEAGLAQSRLWPAGTMCITIAANIAETGILGFPACFPDSVVGFVADTSKCDVHFVEYAFRSIKRQIQHEASGSVQDNINLATLARLRFPVPPLAEQRAIADILGVLDNRIELNRRMTDTLEAIARALFKSWLVDFEPVRAKAEGSEAALPKNVADLFPDRLEDSGLGAIPEGWRVGLLRDVADHPRRAVQPAAIDPSTPYIALEHMPRRRITLSEWTDADGVKSSKFRFMMREILFGKLAPDSHKAGVAPVDGVCSTDIVVIAPRREQWFGLVLGHVSSDAFVERTSAGSTGTTRPRTSWNDMGRYKIVIPSDPVAEAFSTQIRLSVDRMILSVHESRTLAALRDALLPKLISGELRVPQAERMLKAVPV